ncbi:hypothetical protein [Shimazuella kribbensis]|uniref:hypothetical protein n=1 Tax=Shimazuella kribbensis TaxID=139808 RepID=UPI000425BCDD|nr:hypothetical protein [Shimazuella kribbensis]
MSLRLVIEGESNKVFNFMSEVKRTKMYRFYDKTKFTVSPTESKVECYLDESLQMKEKKRNVIKVVLQLSDEKRLEIDILDSKILDLGDKTIVIGKNYDIFAAPLNDVASK